MVLDQTHTFVLGLLIAGAVGARRGWGKEVITCAIVLSNVLFLANGGGAFLAHLFTNGLGSTSSSLGSALFAGGGGGGGPSGGVTAPAYAGTATTAASCYDNISAAMSRIEFLTITPLAYWAGSRHGPKPKLASHNIAGIIPGMVNGAAIAYYVSNYLFPGRQIQLNTPSSGATANLLPIVFLIGIVGMLIILFIAGQVKKAAQSGSH
jgi:hypothetical protein